jgi:3-mercaptopyruvate sulfurtransferase SseA
MRSASWSGAFQELSQRRLAEVPQVAHLYLHGRDELEPVTLTELRTLMRDKGVTVIDVGPRDEDEAGHIPGALSIPVQELKRRQGERPKRKEVASAAALIACTPWRP